MAVDSTGDDGHMTLTRSSYSMIDNRSFDFRLSTTCLAARFKYSSLPLLSIEPDRSRTSDRFEPRPRLAGCPIRGGEAHQDIDRPRIAEQDHRFVDFDRRRHRAGVSAGGLGGGLEGGQGHHENGPPSG